MEQAHKTLISNGKKIEVYSLLTGLISEKESLHRQKYPGPLNKAGFLWDRQFSDFQPIWTWLIVHPEGNFLIDSGLSPLIHNESYLKNAGFFTKWFLESQYHYQLPPENHLATQLKMAGFSVDDIFRVILTHLHFDHTGNQDLFPNTPVLVSKREWVEPYFSIQGLMPTWFNPKLIIFGESEPAGDTLLEGAYLLTEAADLMLIQTPGHTFGHCSVVLKADNAYYLFGGDISTTQDDLVKGIFPPGEADVFASKMTRWKVLDFASRHPLVYMATHDPLSAERLLNGKWLGA